MKPNIIFYFSDQQRWDTITPVLTPNLAKLASEGAIFNNAYTCQPVCGPARACLQTGLYATQCGCFYNGIPLPNYIKPLAEYFNDADYETAYVGKWHLASDRIPKIGFHCETSSIPKDRQGGYKDYWRASDVLEFTSHGYDGYVFDGDGKKIDFIGYRVDCINDFALEYIDNKTSDQPFFMFVSQLEPHHQNDKNCYQGYLPTVKNYSDYPIPADLTSFTGNYKESYPDYLSAINRLDYNVGKLIEKLKEKNIYDNTIIIYTSDHGNHFKTRNLEYKRSCHDSAVHIPLIIGGGANTVKGVKNHLVSLIDYPYTILKLAGLEPPKSYVGIDFRDEKARDNVFIQISESQVGRAIRTQTFKYSIRALGIGYIKHNAKIYFEDYLYDLKNDPNELNNLVKSLKHRQIRHNLAKILKNEMKNAGEKSPIILPAIIKRNH